MNDRDSEIMSQCLSMHGYINDSAMETADLVILNTCSIRAKAEQKVMSLLGALRKIKARRPALQICVAGCVAQQEGKRLIERMPHVDLVMGTQHIYNIYELLEKAAKYPGTVVANLENDYAIPRFIPGATPAPNPSPDLAPQIFRKFVTIMQGCNNYCTYCVVPYTRGREVSRKFNDIIDEVRILIDSGIKEITLLGQNVNSYGQTNQVTSDNHACSFPDLLYTVAEIPGLARLRFTTSNPKDLSENLMRCFRDIPNLCPQFHLPVQAGSDSLLKRMNRKYTVQQYLDLVETLRNYRPDIALTTDIIVGFPGETEEEFQGTMDLLEKVRFHGSFSFKYSDRPGTKASLYVDKISEEIKSRRLSQFQSRQDEISLERNKEYIGQIMEILVEGKHGTTFQGRTTTNHIVHVDSPTSLQAGDLTEVEIIHAGLHSLKGRLLSS
jgi:tRNA-2-methylthio-N6-dimethylallyladenosine synthase